jgi:serine/threonine-protein phosphatase 2B regulatory subunit
VRARWLLRSGDDDGLIDKAEFESSLGLRKSLFADRIFEIFDKNSDNHITFEEFVLGLSTFSARASREAKAQMSFLVHDIDGDGLISREDLGKMVRATIDENALNISDEHFDQLIATTFEQAGAADKPGLTLDDFIGLVKQRPAMLSNMTIASISVSR